MSDLELMIGFHQRKSANGYDDAWQWLDFKCTNYSTVCRVLDMYDATYKTKGGR
jgi:hypothetical protein